MISSLALNYFPEVVAKAEVDEVFAEKLKIYIPGFSWNGDDKTWEAFYETWELGIKSEK